MHGDLREISVSGAAERMGQDEVEEDAGGGDKPVSGEDRGGMTGGRKNLRGECRKQRERIMTRGANLRKGSFIGQSGGKGGNHF